MNKQINSYGDRLLWSSNLGYGGEICSQRIDSLDRMAIHEATRLADLMEEKRPVIYDIGSGLGTMSMKFAEIGCTVITCSMEPMPYLRRFAQETGAIMPGHILQTDARSVDWTVFPEANIIYSQRFLHYIRFHQAVKLIRSVTDRADSCGVYLSISGLSSELGFGYFRAPLENRFGYLSKEMAHKHNIHQKVCLYDMDDAQLLMVLCGLTITRLWLSDFGNIKIQAKR
ncbi:MAG: hypothetical protein OXD47_01975 [Gammaproteobacteria bacterium]|nr:hypothetical protein [Gammaproteobacteria bacterium]MCY4337549.1 hypothetical protein [Gammaproteobacteria bacterium]